MSGRRFLVCWLVVGVFTAGCVGPDESGEGDPDGGDEAAPAGPLVEVFEGNTGESYGTLLLTSNNGEDWQFEVEPRDNTTGYVIEVVWDATAEEHENLDLWIRHESDGMNVPPAEEDLDNFPPGGPLIADKGSSPLRLQVPVDVLEEPGVYHVMVRAYSDPYGTANDQPFTLTIATFEDIPFDPDFQVGE